MTLSSGQALALSQLEEICQADQHAFEIREKNLPTPERKYLRVRIGLHCGTLLKREGGLPLRERELFWILVPVDFPFTKPAVWTQHTRFAGWPHVQWKKHLCLYQAPETEWDPADGMYGFVERLWLWLCHGAANELNPPDLPIHPPVAYTSESEYILVPKTNTPIITDLSWLGWAELHKTTDIRFDVIGWQSIDEPIKTSEISAPVVLLSKELPWEMPSKLEDLIIELEAQGISRSILISLLRISILQNDKNQPLLFIIGTPQRGGAGGKERHQHLMAWHIDQLLVDTARMSLEKFSEYGPLRDIGKDAELLFFEIVKTIDISWIKVLENRPEVTIRRDFNSPIQAFAGASVCLWGCGAIGSHAAYVLVKAGISRIILIDNGIVKPGLLVRQLYDDIDVGLPKADILASRLRKLRSDLIVEAYCLNILGILEPENDWTYGADIVLDCTASHSMQAKLEVITKLAPAKNASTISMMVGPRSNRAIVVISPPNYSGSVKDVFRKAKITACRDNAFQSICEDFYPTSDHIEFFQPEPGCSDATFIGSAADICTLTASMLNVAAVELSKAPIDAHAFLLTQPYIVYANPEESAITHFKWPKDIVIGASYEIRVALNAWSEIVGWIRKSKRMKGKAVETGGVLFGKRDDSLRVIWIDAVSGPPPDSRSSRTEFVCGTKGVEEMHESWKKLTRGSVEFIGMWHTHPEDMPIPSTRDICGMAQILTIGDPPAKKSLLLIVGLLSNNPVLGVTVFERITATDNPEMIQAKVETAVLSGLEI